MPVQSRVRSAAQIDHFVTSGFVRIDNAFSEDLAAQCRAILWADAGVDPNDPKTWTKPVIRLGHYSQPPFIAAGTVYLCHRFLAHAAQPHRGMHPRIIAQPPLLPSTSLQLERDGGAYSPVEQATRLALA